MFTENLMNNIAIHQARAQFNAAIRQFFEQRHVTEVETPLLARATVTAPHIDSFATTWQNSSVDQKIFYLQTSPEYAMKRLLVAGSGDIFQICKAFRDEGCGQYHNPEFSMLEWYRVGQDLPGLMAEVKDLILHIQNYFKPDDLPLRATYFSYQELFLHYAGIDPFNTSVQQLQQFAFEQNIVVQHMPEGHTTLTHDDWLSIIQSNVIEPQFQDNTIVFIDAFPATQAALARLDVADPNKARRFECYLGKLELANGYDEAGNATELRQRFIQDNVRRQQLGKTILAADQQFLDAMVQGLPACVGVALGLDRLLMWALECHNIQDVVAFTMERA